ncbi:MAG: flavodoxin family protein [Spirochaetales bacterium]|nr:flavodoxin family protein [Spirochaetales bacterium]
MNKKTTILTILGSPHNAKSNTKAFVDDFVEEIAKAGLALEHTVIPLSQKKVSPCKGCWNCTQEKPCPLANDSLEEIKLAMIECDMLIMASPVYTNQITSQMKALFDRLFTWCHIFPLLGKYSLSACTTGNDGMKPVGDFLQMMLATYGTFSFGHIQSMGGFTPGFFPFRDKAREKNKKLAKIIADTINHCKELPISSLQKKMFGIMSKKMNGSHIFRYLAGSEDKADAKPSAFKLKLIKKILTRSNMTNDQIHRISKMMAFEYTWWKERGWFKAKSFRQLVQMPVPENFNVKKRLLARNIPAV